MTDPTTLVLVIGGCILVALAWGIWLETGPKRRQRRATGARTASHVEPEHQSTPALPEASEGDYPDGWMPLRRMTRDEVEAHLWRLEGNPGGYIPEAWPKRTVRTVDLTPPENVSIHHVHSVDHAVVEVRHRGYCDVERVIEDYAAEHLPGWKRDHIWGMVERFTDDIVHEATYLPPEEER